MRNPVTMWLSRGSTWIVRRSVDRQTASDPPIFQWAMCRFRVLLSAMLEEFILIMQPLRHRRGIPVAWAKMCMLALNRGTIATGAVDSRSIRGILE